MPYIEITQQNCNNVKQDLLKNRVIMVYYMKSCGYCQEFMPKLDNLLNSNTYLEQIAKIYKTELSNMQYLPSNLQNVNAFPTIHVYTNGEKSNEFIKSRTPISNVAEFILDNKSISLPSSLSKPKIKPKPKTTNKKIKVVKNTKNSI